MLVLQHQDRRITQLDAQRICQAMHRQLVFLFCVDDQQVDVMLFDQSLIVTQAMSQRHDLFDFERQFGFFQNVGT